LAKESFAGLISLREHFRCVPDIIQFSNHLCYQGDIKPLREERSSPIHPFLVPFRVEGARDGDTEVNREEALTVASLLVAAVERPEYQCMTFGVISLLGDGQAPEIEQSLRKHLSPDEYQRRRIICGNSAQFQGDERDVMFLSMVWSPEDAPLRFLDDKRFRQRFNVAASRARNQMWLAYSLNPSTDLKSGDLRRRLIEHVLDPRAVTRDLDRSLARTDSPFERYVLEGLVRAGYRAIPQWPVGNYRIDLVVEGGGKRMAVECDGDRYHPPEKLAEDMERQAILERLGWRFVRIRGSVFFRDRERTMQGVFHKLAEGGISPEGIEIPPVTEEDALVSTLRRRASELRAAWQDDLNAEGQNVAGNAPQPGHNEPRRKPEEGETRGKRMSKKPSGFQRARQKHLFPVEDNGTLPPGPDAAVASGPIVAVASGPAIRKTETRVEPDGHAANNLQSRTIDSLLAVLDKTVFPAVAGSEPRGSRRTRLELWSSSLALCDFTPEALYAALTEADPTIANGSSGQKVVAAIRSWCAEKRH
jgi:very-short-patch-repair endonuclease